MQTLDPIAAPPRESREELLAKARALIGERRIPAAFAVLHELVDFDLHDAEAWSPVAQAWHQWGHGDRCQRAAELALRVDAQAPSGHVWRCRGLLMQEQTKPALEAARDGMSATERHPEVHRALLEALLANERLPEAELNLRDLRTQFPDDPDLVVRQGELHFHKKEYAAAETAFLSVLTTASDPADARSWLGATRLRQERRKDAVPCYYRAALSSAAGFAYTKLLVEIVDALLRRKLDYTLAAYVVAALIAAAIAYSIHPILTLVSIPALIWFWKRLRAVLVNDSLRSWPKELGDYYREQKPIVDRHGAASLGLA